MKTVIQFIHELGDGGGSTIVKDYAINLERDGYKVVVVVVFPEYTSVNYQIINDAGIEILSVYKDKRIIYRLINKIIPKFFIARKLKHVVRQYKPLALHAHLPVLQYLQLCSKQLKETKLVYTCHSLPDKYFTGRHAVEYSAAKYLIRNNKLQMIALHEEMKKQLQCLFGISNVYVVSNGIDLQRFFTANPNKAELRDFLGIPTDSFVIGHIGRFSKVKNHKFLIEVFSQIHKERKDAFLLLVGTGELKVEIETYIAELNLESNILILTHRKDIPELLKIMDVFVFPSLWEGLGVVLIESQATKLRCVISDTVPKDSILSNYVTSLNLHSNTISEWKDEILKQEEATFQGDFSLCDIKCIIKTVERIYEE